MVTVLVYLSLLVPSLASAGAGVAPSQLAAEQDVQDVRYPGIEQLFAKFEAAAAEDPVP